MRIVKIKLLLLCLAFISHVVYAEGEAGKDNVNKSVESSESKVIHAFTIQEGDVESNIIKIDDQRKRQIMFAMGVPLLIFIMITVGLGIAMGVFGKDVYIAHMIFAGLSLTLALGHAVVGLVWFWPF
jgi:hypothetical protein